MNFGLLEAGFGVDILGSSYVGSYNFGSMLGAPWYNAVYGRFYRLWCASKGFRAPLRLIYGKFGVDPFSE